MPKAAMFHACSSQVSCHVHAFSCISHAYCRAFSYVRPSSDLYFAEDVKSEWLPMQREAWTSGPNMVGAGEETWEALESRFWSLEMAENSPKRLCSQLFRGS